MLKTILEEYISDPKRHRIYERESLALQASEMILELMEKEGITKKELAERIEASKAHVTQVLSGSRNMTLHTLADFLYALGRKAELDAIPLHGTHENYVPVADRQKYLFGNAFPDPSDFPEADGEPVYDEEDLGVEGNLPIAA
jgi:transcriptional regulator with XRE-family HTH domain